MKFLAVLALASWVAVFWSAAAGKGRSGPYTGYLLITANVTLALTVLIR
jgi:hypothetical protein